MVENPMVTSIPDSDAAIKVNNTIIFNTNFTSTPNIASIALPIYLKRFSLMGNPMVAFVSTSDTAIMDNNTINFGINFTLTFEMFLFRSKSIP